jgi:hypothetical protein
VTFTYPGWSVELKKVEQHHVKNENFSREFGKMQKQQKIHDGDRSHPQLSALDSVRFTYPGWCEGFKEAEQHHIQTDPLFDRKFSLMTRKQKFHDGDRSHYQLRALDAVKVTLT